jgi:hypothetical protein
MDAVGAQCAKHHFDPAVAVCGRCDLTFCQACLVYAFGPNRPPFCIPCALTAGGVRHGATVAKVPWRERRARKKALAAQQAESGGDIDGAGFPAEADLFTPFDSAFAD